MLDYKLIEALARVVQDGGFDRAANGLHITQSAVSQRVKQLEEQMGQILLARSTPPKPTAAGRKLLKHYLQVKRLEEDLFIELEKNVDQTYISLAIGLNADSLATWFLDVIRPLVIEQGILLDVRVDDQEQTHRFLKNGDVVGCISTRDQTLQGCRIDYLGRMNYHLLSAPEFAKRWFSDGLTLGAVRCAPAVIFNRKDELHYKLLQQVLAGVPDTLPVNYMPSAEKFVDALAMGLGYGMLPLQQSESLLQEGRLVDLAPGYTVPVKLYWHCWNLQSKPLLAFTKQLLAGAKRLLEA